MLQISVWQRYLWQLVSVMSMHDRPIRDEQIQKLFKVIIFAEVIEYLENSRNIRASQWAENLEGWLSGWKHQSWKLARVYSPSWVQIPPLPPIEIIKPLLVQGLFLSISFICIKFAEKQGAHSKPYYSVLDIGCILIAILYLSCNDFLLLCFDKFSC